MILRNSRSVGKKACVLLALVCARDLRGLQYLCFARGCIHARWQKTFMLKLYRLHRHSRTWCAWPGERGLERLFSITANYITVRLAVRAKS